jgi:hypothetical protein
MMTPALSKKYLNTAKERSACTFKVDKDTVASAPRLALTDNDSGHNLLLKIRLSLLNGGHNHITNTRGWQTIKTALNALNGNDVEILSARVIGTVDHSTDGETEGH